MDSRELVSRVSMMTGLAHETVEARILSVAAVLADACQELDSVAVPGFGTFLPEKKAEEVVTASDGSRTLLPPAVTVAFKSSVILKKALGK